MITIEVIAPASNEDAIIRIAKQNDASDYWLSSSNDKQVAIKVLVDKSKSQKILDQLQTLMKGKSNFRVLASPLDIALPYEKTSSSNNNVTISREALLSQLKVQGKLDSHYMMLVFLSTIVAAIGLIQNNVAVIIGAMVIAPLLGPNLALSLSTALGQVNGILNALRTLAVGILFALIISVGVAQFYPDLILTTELLSRTSVEPDDLILALASGAAAALSITTGVSSVLVGVMVAVALLPPTVALGICLGIENFAHAKGAALLLIANIASLNLTAQLTMRMKGIKPREAEKQRTALIVFIIGIVCWCALIAYLVYSISYF